MNGKQEEIIKQYEQIIEAVPAGIFYFDKNGILKGCNEYFVKIIGSSKEKLINLDLINKLQNKDVVSEIKKCIATGTGFYRGEYSSIIGNKNFYSRGKFNAIKDKNGNFIIGVCLIDDITIEYEQERKLIDLNNEYATLNEAFYEQNEELKRANEELNYKNESLIEEKKLNEQLLKELTITEKNYRTIFYNSPIPMIVHHKGKIVLINDAAIKFGEIQKVEDVIGKPVMMFVHPNSHKTAIENIKKVIQGKKTGIKEEKFITVKGNVKDVVVNSSQFIYNEQTALLVAFADISEIKESEKEIAEINKQLKERNTLLEKETKKNKKILESLINTERNYRTIFDNSPIPMVVHQNGKFVLANEAAIKFANLNNESEYIGQDIKHFIHPDSHKTAEQNITKALNGESIDVVEEKFIVKGNITKYGLLKTGPFIYNGKPALLAAFLDITELKESQEKLRIITKGIEYSPTSVIITDTESNIQYVNPKFTDVTGYTPEEAIGKNTRIFKSNYHDDKFYKIMRERISSGNSWRGEICNKKKNGELFWEYGVISPIFDDLGKITHYIAIKEDITKRKEIEQKLLQNEKHFKTIYDTAPDGIFETNSKWFITNCNKAFAESVKLSKSEIIGKHSIDFIEDTDLFKKLYPKLVKKGYLESEIVQKNGDGSTIIVWRKATAIYDKNNNFIGAIAYSRDITQIKEFEKQLIQAKEKAEEADKLKTAFLSNMSHEIRTPLNAIIGFSELLINPNITDDTKRTYSEYIKHNTSLLLNLINDIIDISKIEANQIKITKTMVNLKNIFEELHQIFEKDKRKNTEVVIKLEPKPEKLLIETDEYRLRQIISNLVINAIKFTDKGEIKFGYYTKKDKLIIYVEDTGIGIKESSIKKIFDRFIKLESQINKDGTGLGLAIVKSLTKLLEGEVSVSSKYGKGTRFEICFPLNKMKSELKSFKTNNFDINDFDWQNKTLLVAEDDDFNFIVMEEYIKGSGINIIRAKNGKEAIDLYKKHKDKIDLVLMDIQMPIINGYNASVEILNLNPNAKIIVQTAYAMSNEKTQSLEIGCIDYITKPIDVDILILLLANYLS